MRLLILPPSDYLGHPNPCRLHHIFEQFPSYGDEVYVMRFPLRDKIVRKSTATVFSMNDYKFKTPSSYYLLNSGVFAKSAADIVRKYNIDAVIFANLLPPYMVSKVIPKHVLSVVDLVDHYPAVALENTPKAFPKPFVNVIYSHLMRSVISKCDLAVGCSYTLAEYAKQNGARKVCRIPNGVEDYFFADYNKEAVEIRLKIGAGDSDLVMCFVGNLEYWLNMKDLIDALYRVKKNTTRRIKFIIVGASLSSNYANEVQKQVDALCLKENFVNMGFVNHSDVPKYIAASDLCVSPKNINDPVSYYSAPVKVLEYLAQGKPVISTPIPEVVIAEKDYVSIANSAEEYYSCIKSFIDNPSSFLEKGRRGREFARKQTWTKISADYRSLLKHYLKTT
jgi:glycosyltransferase involved in cell wall biosynthesis